MAAVTLARVPFGEVGASRLQALQSAKNRQNAVTEALRAKIKAAYKSGKPSNHDLPSVSTKRSADVFEEDNISDSENIDPVVLLSPKRSKHGNTTIDPFAKEPMLALSVDKTSPADRTTLASPQKRKHLTTPECAPVVIKASSSTPAGRDILPLKHKRVGALANGRQSSPFRRVDPPVFASAKSSGSSMPFSIESALRGTLAGTPEHVHSRPKKRDRSHRSQPKSWFFDIHEDSPDEALAIELQHSTSTIDLSSEDEDGPARKRLREDKENVPPPDDLALAHVTMAPRSRARATQVDLMTDDGDRSPLSDLAPEDYYGNGLDKDSVAIVQDAPFSTEDVAAIPKSATVDESPENAGDIRSTPSSQVCLAVVTQDAGL